jgi:hypothetical protein
MILLDPIYLNTEWLCYPLPDVNPAYIAAYNDDSTWEVLVKLADWPRHLLQQTKIVFLHHRFDLEPIGNICLRFILHLEDAPDGTNVILNGQHLETFYGGQPFEKDVTDYLTLDDNLLRFEVKKVGPFGDVRLKRVPCENS